MSKMQRSSAKSPFAAFRSAMNPRTLTGCALMAALSVVLARLIVPMPNVTTRFSIEAVPIFIAGMLFGPVAGGLVGFTADLVGCLFSGYGYNPIFCVPPILYGVVAGLFRPMLAKGISLPRLALAFLPSVVLGSVLYQSFSLALVYGGSAFWPFFLTKLEFRSIQFAITMAADVLIVWLLHKSNAFTAVKLWPPAVKKTEQKESFTMEIKRFTKSAICHVLDFEAALRQEEPFYHWAIDGEYQKAVEKSFEDPKFAHSLSLLAYVDGRVVGRIDSSLICSHFDGSVKAYLDWICVLKSARHSGVAQGLMQELRAILRQEYQVDTLIALMAANAEAQRFYRSIKNAEIHDEGIWISC